MCFDDPKPTPPPHDGPDLSTAQKMQEHVAMIGMHATDVLVKVDELIGAIGLDETKKLLDAQGDPDFSLLVTRLEGEPFVQVVINLHKLSKLGKGGWDE